MCTQDCVFESLSAEDQAFLLTPTSPTDCPDFDSLHPQASLFHELYFRDRQFYANEETSPLRKLIIAIDGCGRSSIGFHHPCGNVTGAHTLYCRKAAHRDCAEHEARENYETISLRTRHLATRNPSWHTLWAEVHLPYSPTPAAVKRLKESAKESFLSLLPGALAAYQSKHTPSQEIHCVVAGLSDSGQLVIRFLTYGPATCSLQQIRDAFPTASKVIPAVAAIDELSNFIKFTLRPMIPNSPQLQADMCIAFEGVRKLETFGQAEPASASDAEKMQTEHPSYATSPQEGETKKPHLCPYCQSESTGRKVVGPNEHPRCQFMRFQMVC